MKFLLCVGPQNTYLIYGHLFQKHLIYFSRFNKHTLKSKISLGGTHILAYILAVQSVTKWLRMVLDVVIQVTLLKCKSWRRLQLHQRCIVLTSCNDLIKPPIKKMWVPLGLSPGVVQSGKLVMTVTNLRVLLQQWMIWRSEPVEKDLKSRAGQTFHCSTSKYEETTGINPCS
jgi:hypothetical protein